MENQINEKYFKFKNVEVEKLRNIGIIDSF